MEKVAPPTTAEGLPTEPALRKIRIPFLQRGTVAIVPAAFRADATRVPELWLIPPDGRPRPVGLLRADAPVTLTLSGDLAGLAKNNAVLAVSLEPPGGSTTGLPTGPVIGTGKLTNL